MNVPVVVFVALGGVVGLLLTWASRLRSELLARPLWPVALTSLALAAFTLGVVGSEFNAAYLHRHSPGGRHTNPLAIPLFILEAAIVVAVLVLTRTRMRPFLTRRAQLLGPMLLTFYVVTWSFITQAGRPRALVLAGLTGAAVLAAEHPRVASTSRAVSRSDTYVLALAVLTAIWAGASMAWGISIAGWRLTLISQGQTGAGAHIAAGLVAAASVAAAGRPWMTVSERRMLTYGAGLLYLAMVMNATRAAIVSAAVAGGYILVRDHRDRRRFLIGSAALLVATAGAVAYVALRRGVTSVGTATSLSGRGSIWSIATEGGLPIFGEGWSSPIDRLIGRGPDVWVGNTHNAFLQGGLMFGVLWVGVLIACFYIAWRGAESTAIRGVLIVLALNGFSDAALGRESGQLMILFAFTALAAPWSRRFQRTTTPEVA